MQIDITLKKDRIRLPISTGATVQGLLYHALKEDASYSAKLHEYGNACDGRKFKLFTFGELQGRYEVEGHYITFLSEARLSVRSADAYFIQLLFAYFSKKLYVDLADDRVEVTNVRLLDKHIFTDTVTVRTASPITVYMTEENGHTLYFTPKDTAFYNGILRNARRKWISCFGDDRGFSLEITPVEGAGFKKCVTRFKDTFITAWHGTFVLTAPAQVLDFLYQTGIGSKNSQGFGMFSIID